MTISIDNVTIGNGVVIEGIPASYVVTGLQLYLDAANYSGSGSTWQANVGSNATLFNTPTYTASSPTYFNFDPTSSEYASSSALSSASNWTVEAWFRVNSSLNNVVTSIVCDEFNLSSNLNFSIGTNNAPTNYNLCVGFFNGAWRNTTGFIPSLNTWTYSAGTYDGSTLIQYKDGISIDSLSYTGTSAAGGVSTRIARRWDSALLTSNLFPGDIALVRIYNTALTSGQILQNYNAQKARFGY